MPAATAETVTQSARTVADQSKVFADETIETARQSFEVSQAMYLAMLESGFQTVNRLFDFNRVMLDQADAATRELRGLLDSLAEQRRRQQETWLNFARANNRIVENTWLGVYRNGRPV